MFNKKFMIIICYFLVAKPNFTDFVIHNYFFDILLLLVCSCTVIVKFPFTVNRTK